MENEFAHYELAVKLKKLGFNEPCIMQRSVDDDLIFCVNLFGHPAYKTNIESQADSSREYIAVPTYSQSFKWFREKHDLNAFITTESDNHAFVGYNANIDSDNLICKIGIFDTYIDAEDACIEKLIELVEHKLKYQ